jgi:hypothetical protein
MAVAALAVLAAACSSHPPTAGVASLRSGSGAGGVHVPTVAQSDQAMLDFTRCMRQHGVQMSDPVHLPGHDGLSIDIPDSGPNVTAGRQACTHYLQAIITAKAAHQNQLMASQLPGRINYARCMRAHDISMPDPGPDGELNLGNVPGINNGFGRYTPEFRAADTACRHLLPPGTPDDGTGP